MEKFFIHPKNLIVEIKYNYSGKETAKTFENYPVNLYKINYFYKHLFNIFEYSDSSKRINVGKVFLISFIDLKLNWYFITEEERNITFDKIIKQISIKI